MEYASASWLRKMRCLIPWSMGTLSIFISYHIMTHVYRLDWQTRPVDFAANNMLSLSTWTYASQVLPQIARQTSTLNDERIWKLTWRQGCPFQWVDGPTVLAKQWNAGKVMYVIWGISCNLFWSDTSLGFKGYMSSMRARIRLGSHHAVGPCWTVEGAFQIFL